MRHLWHFGEVLPHRCTVKLVTLLHTLSPFDFFWTPFLTPFLVDQARSQKPKVGQPRVGSLEGRSVGRSARGGSARSQKGQPARGQAEPSQRRVPSQPKKGVPRRVKRGLRRSPKEGQRRVWGGPPRRVKGGSEEVQKEGSEGAKNATKVWLKKVVVPATRAELKKVQNRDQKCNTHSSNLHQQACQREVTLGHWNGNFTFFQPSWGWIKSVSWGSQGGSARGQPEGPKEGPKRSARGSKEGQKGSEEGVQKGSGEPKMPPKYGWKKWWYLLQGLSWKKYKTVIKNATHIHQIYTSKHVSGRSLWDTETEFSPFF